MDNKKFNIFAMLMIVIMGAFCIFMGLKDTKGEDGVDGKSAYELAVEKGFNGSELEYLQSLQGKDGSNITIEDVYFAYLKVNNLTQDQCSFAKFISEYYPDVILDEAAEQTLTEYATAQALRSTVDIVYSCYMNSRIISVSQGTYDEQPVYILNGETKTLPTGLSAGSGVIYKVNESTAYIITNYHVAYVSNYSNDASYRVYYDETTGEYFTGKHESSSIKTGNFSNGIMYIPANYISKSDITFAPTSTHFLNNYEIYLYGYQAQEYALSATFVGGSAENDIAVLKIDKNASENNKRIFTEDYKAASIADSTKIVVGEKAIAVGNPLIPNTSGIDTSNINTIKEHVDAYKQRYIDALCLTATDGVVSNISEYQTFGSILYDGKDANMRLIRVSSAINAGNSGGGLYDIEGKLIGIVNGKIASSDYDNVGYAIPVNVAVNLADRIISECEGTAAGDVNINIISAENLGLTLSTTREGDKSSYYDENTLSWVNSGSVLVEQISATGIASLAGIKQGDLINSIKIGETVYELNNDYDFNNILLKVAYPQSYASIVLNVTTQGVSGLLETKEVTILVLASQFTTLQ